MNSCAAFTPRMTNPPGNVHPCEQRILLRYWGSTENQVPVLLQGLPTFQGRVAWSDDVANAVAPDLVIHLIEPSYLQTVLTSKPQGGEMEPAVAMRRGFRRGDKEIALVLGSATLLPQKRYGCWITAGRRNAADALGIIARTLVEPVLEPANKYRWNLHDLAEANMLGVLATESANDEPELGRKVIAALGTVLGLSVTTPARIVVAAPEPVIASIERSYPIDRERIHLVRQSENENTSADMLIAYPWPAGLMK